MSDEFLNLFDRDSGHRAPAAEGVPVVVPRVATPELHETERVRNSGELLPYGPHRPTTGGTGGHSSE